MVTLMRTFIVAFAGIALILSSAATAHADSTRLVVGGDPTSAAKVTTMASKWLERRGLPLEAPSPAADAAIAACLVKSSAPQCKATIAGDATLWFLSVEADIADRSTNLVIVARYFDSSGALMASERQGCERCNDDSLRQATHDVLEALWRTAGARAGEETALKVTTSPDGATISVEGQAIGKAPVTYNVVPGTHKVSASADGYRPQTRSVTLNAGEIKDLSFTLAPEQPASQRRPRWAWGLTIGGGAALVAGGAMVLLDKGAQDADIEARQYTSFRTAGFVVGGVGAAAVAVGIWGLIRTPPASGKGKATGPNPSAAALAPYVGWSSGDTIAGVRGVFP